MQECVKHAMTEEQLARFLVANGLCLSKNQWLAREGEVVGIVRRPYHGPLVVTVFEEKQRRDGCEVMAWLPAFRPAWTLVTSGGEVEVGELLGPDEVICDLCNADINTRPVPVVNVWALCGDCFPSFDLPFPGRIRPYQVQAEE